MIPYRNRNGTVAMTSMTLKNLPDDLYRQLKASASLHRRSINAEAILCLERSLLREHADVATFLARARDRRGLAHRVFVTDEDLSRAKQDGRP